VKYYSVNELAERFSVDHKTIRRLIRTGKLSAVKIAGAIRVAENDLFTYLAGASVPAKRKPAAKVPIAAGRRAGRLKYL
jgi:excisionase family DNA binding protein